MVSWEDIVIIILEIFGQERGIHKLEGISKGS